MTVYNRCKVFNVKVGVGAKGNNYVSFSIGIAKGYLNCVSFNNHIIDKLNPWNGMKSCKMNEEQDVEFKVVGELQNDPVKRSTSLFVWGLDFVIGRPKQKVVVPEKLPQELVNKEGNGDINDIDLDWLDDLK